MSDKQSWRTTLSLTALGIVSALIGATVQHFLNLDRERSLAFQERQTAAYVAFLKAFPKSSLARREIEAGNRDNGTKLELEFEVEGQAAVRQIALSGDRQVVAAVAKWYHEGQLAPCSEPLKTEFAFWEGMRRALLGDSQNVSPKDLAAVTVFCKLQ